MQFLIDIYSLYCHIKKLETLEEAYRQVKEKNGAKGLLTIPLQKKRDELPEKIRGIFSGLKKKGILQIAINKTNEILRGWENYFSEGSRTRRGLCPGR